MKKDVVVEDPKLPYTKPALTKHQPLRDITAGNGSIQVPELPQ